MDIPFEARIARDPKFRSPAGHDSLAFIPVTKLIWDYATSEGVKAANKAASQSRNEKFSGFFSRLTGSSSTKPDLPSEEFIHSPLEDSKGLRLVSVDVKDSTLSCSLRTYSASEIPPYVCLSYVWADLGPTWNRERDFREGELEVPRFSHADTVDISVNYRRLSIGANLHAALLGLARHLNGRPIWIDAICINQKDKDEKTLQVARMGQIYSAAEKVFVWLGRKHQERNAAMSILKLWPVFPDDPNKADIQFKGKKYTTARAFFDATSTGSELISWLNLLRLVTESWWSRVWTAQEFILAEDYSFFYDGEEIPATLLKSAMDWTYFVASHCSPKMIPHWVTFQPSIFDLKRSGTKLHLFDVTLLGATRMAGDPRDKVWAFLGITDPTTLGETPLKPDYGNRNMGDFYLDIAQRLLDQYKAKKRLPSHNPEWEPPKEDVFDESLQPGWSGKKAGYPSWVPKMASAVATEPLFLREMKAQKARGRQLYDSSWRIFNAASRVRGDFSLSADGRVLTLNAHILDGIIKITPLPKNKEFENSFHKSVRSWYGSKSWDPRKGRLADAPYPPQPSSTVPEALWRTLSMNIWLTTHPAPEVCEEYFANYLARISGSASGVKRDLRCKHQPDPEEGDIFAIALSDAGNDRALFSTERGYLGLGPARTEVGDVVVLIAGAHVPFVLRKGAGGWILVGETYVHGVMYGEASGKADFQRFDII
ncbi:hypothetical protein F53441_8643 [Fusarium austroafricanum]|uniref:Heterokaryon incompatibility domain-containing protein n=1 Tax=Fusarium austroafricanum TaxID=2364996 RepID=A0A8H4KE43_9HYPO|nr:hypothetical protein F53441_8643 [Fusarium austroafricanum]